MRNKDLEEKRNIFVKEYYRWRKRNDKTLTKQHIAGELNSFFVFCSKSNIYNILKGE